VEAACKRLYREAQARGESVRLLVATEHLPQYKGYATVALGSLKQPETIAHTLFAALRQMDDEGVDTIYCEAVSMAGIGLAIMNRLRRAAAFHIERV